MQTEAKAILEAVKSGEMSVDDALLRLKTEPYKDLGFAKVDLHREIRQGAAEVIYGEGKTPGQIISILDAMTESGLERVLITRLDDEKASYIMKFRRLLYNEAARVGIVGHYRAPDGIGKIVIATGGTSDLTVAEEAAVTCEFYGNEVVKLYDVGVAGIHRILSHKEEIMSASVIIVIAGMEGALASVIGGMADCPVIALPTSVGYGANFDGLSALLSMINSCAAGIGVVNIDNGFGAGYLASRINHMEAKR